jgi:hypothetical protein
MVFPPLSPQSAVLRPISVAIILLTAATVPTLPRTIDILALTDPTQDTVSGAWSKLDGTLTCIPGDIAHIEFPYIVPDEYDLRILFVRSSGTGDMAVILHGGDHQFVWRMGGRRNSAAGFGTVDGKAFGRNPSSKQAEEWLTTGQQEELIIQVRRDSVSTILNENPVSTLKTNFQNLALGQMFAQHRSDTLGIYVNHDDLTIESAEITEITASGRPVR